MSAPTTQAVTVVLVTVDMNWILMKSLALVRNIMNNLISIILSINILFSTYQHIFEITRHDRIVQINVGYLPAD